jgi:ketosteroid isomerase-like protein
MKTAILATATLALTSPVFAQTAEEAAVITVIESVATFADRGEFDALERLYAPEVRVDYTSLAGGQPEVKSNVALMTEWANVLPGFDRTHHAVTNIRVTIDGVQATATANVVADHWIGRQFWQVSGRYDYGLVRDGRNWRITYHRLTVTGEEGTRDVFGSATEAARATPNAYIVRQQARATVLRFLEGLETKNMEQVNSVWAEDAVQDMPFSPPGHPKRVVGRDALIALYAGCPQASGAAEFTDGIVFHPTLDPETVFVEYRGVVEVIPTGRTYRQTYGGLFHVENGQITLFREYYDPAPFAWAFGLN